VENIQTPLFWKITAVSDSVVATVKLIKPLICLSDKPVNDSDEDEGLCFSASFGNAPGVLETIPVRVVILYEFYSDWIFCALPINLVGVPSGDNGYLDWVSRVPTERGPDQADTRLNMFCSEKTTILSHSRVPEQASRNGSGKACEMLWLRHLATSSASCTHFNHHSICCEWYIKCLLKFPRPSRKHHVQAVKSRDSPKAKSCSLPQSTICLFPSPYLTAQLPTLCLSMQLIVLT
jgi:hypothetical protein